MSLQLMKERIKYSGSNIRSEQIKDAQDILNYGFRDDVSYDPNMVFYETRDPIPIKMYDKKYSSSYGSTSQFLTSYNNPVELGELLYDTKKNEYWLCIESYDVSGIHYDGKLGKCMKFLKWQDEYGTIKEIPIIATTASKYNNGEEGIRPIFLGSDQLMLYTKLTEDTLKLDRGAKFFMDENTKNPSVYQITRVDSTLYTYMGKGYIAIIATECPYTPTQEELELGVCSYKKISTAPPLHPLQPDEMAGLKAVIYGGTKLRNSYIRAYTVKFTGKDNNEISWNNVDFRWNVVSDINLEITKKVYNDRIELFIDDEGHINDSFLLQVIMDDTVIAEIEITIIE